MWIHRARTPPLLVEALFEANTLSEPLENCFGVSADVRLITEADLSRISENSPDQWWKAFYKRYPRSQGVMKLSRVVFDASLTRALVYAGNQIGSLEGKGFVVLLRREPEGWRVEAQVALWDS